MPGIPCIRGSSGGVAFQHNLPTAGGDQWGIADELDRVSVSGFGMEKNRAAVECRPTPSRLSEFTARRRNILASPAPFIFRPGLSEITLQEKYQTEVVMGLGEFGFEIDCLAEGGNSLIEQSPVAENIAEVVMHFGNVRLDALSMAKGADGLVKLTIFVQGVGQVVVSFVHIRLEADGFTEGRDGLIKRSLLRRALPRSLWASANSGLKRMALP